MSPLVHFPIDVLINILNRLPSTSIVRFQTVSKYWCYVICMSDVLNARSESSLISIQLITSLISGELTHFNFDDKGNSKKSVHNINLEGALHYTFSNMVNGLACAYGNGTTTDFYLISLNTFETSKYSKSEIKGITIRYDQISLGFAPSTGSHKFIRIYLHSESLSYYCEILEIGVSFEGSWKIIGKFPDMVDVANPVFLNGAIHWLKDSPSLNKDKPLAFNILKLDMKEEKFEMVAPNVKNEFGQNGHEVCKWVNGFRLSGDNGKLYVLHWCYERKYLYGWRLKESEGDEGVWNVVFGVNFALMTDVVPWFYLDKDENAYVVGIVDDKVLIRSEIRDGGVYIYDLVHKKLSEHGDVYCSGYFSNCRRLLFYRGSNF